MITENKNINENEFEIVMGDDIELNFSEVGDMINELKPNTSQKKKNIIIPPSKKKEKTEKEENDNDK